MSLSIPTHPSHRTARTNPLREVAVTVHVTRSILTGRERRILGDLQAALRPIAPPGTRVTVRPGALTPYTVTATGIDPDTDPRLVNEIDRAVARVIETVRNLDEWS